MKFLVFMPGDPEDRPAIEAGVPDQALEQVLARIRKAAESGAPDPLSYATFSAQFVVTPLRIAQPGVIKVRAVRGDELVRLGMLNVIQGDQTSPSDEAAN